MDGLLTDSRCQTLFVPPPLIPSSPPPRLRSQLKALHTTVERRDAAVERQLADQRVEMEGLEEHSIGQLVVLGIQLRREMAEQDARLTDRIERGSTVRRQAAGGNGSQLGATGGNWGQLGSTAVNWFRRDSKGFNGIQQDLSGFESI